MEKTIIYNVIQIVLKNREKSVWIRYEKQDHTQGECFEEDVLKMQKLEDEAWIHLSNGYDSDLVLNSSEVAAYEVTWG